MKSISFFLSLWVKNQSNQLKLTGETDKTINFKIKFIESLRFVSSPLSEFLISQNKQLVG